MHVLVLFKPPAHLGGPRPSGSSGFFGFLGRIFRLSPPNRYSDFQVGASENGSPEVLQRPQRLVAARPGSGTGNPRPPRTPC